MGLSPAWISRWSTAFMSIRYGIKRAVADTGSCADTYLFANQMAPVGFPNDWLNVCSINSRCPSSIRSNRPVRRS